ncbi:MAG: helix-turn-helix transcriptional regulator [Rikenellaceae bacterium]|nr:helix-turn-helix transcriptional regulator [Rikenellaceae bacterium]
MREKLLKLMKSEKLSSSRLAEILEIQPSSISHILSGRNKPSYDFLVKILRRFPTLNPDWLLLDAEQMYRSNEELDRRINDTNTQSSQTTGSAEKMIVNSKSALNPKNEISQNSTNRPIENIAAVANIATDGRTIERVIVLYTDKSFEAYYLK